MTEKKEEYDTSPKNLNALKEQYEERGGNWNAALQLIDEATGGKDIAAAMKDGWTIADFNKLLLGSDEESEAPGPPSQDPIQEITNPSFTEAPASFNVKAISPQGFDVMLTLRDADTMELMKRGHKSLDWLISKGYKPTGRHSGGNGGNNQASVNQGEAPLCPTHNKPMLPSKHKAGEWYCPVKIADDDGTGKPFYCKQKVKA